jgi:mitochondrial fission protein ELM1
MKVAVLKDNKAGHYNQSLALAYAIEKGFDEVPTDIYTIKVYKLPKYLLRFMLNNSFFRSLLSKPSSLRFVKFFYKIDKPLKVADIIISSGKDTSMLNVWLSLAYDAKSIYIGHPKKLNYKLFDRVLTILDLGFENQVLLDVAPTLPYSGDIEQFCKDNNLDINDNYYALLIGGDGSGYHYSKEEYDKLIEFVNSHRDKKWLVTTSRRTPSHIEEKMQRDMRCAMFVAYHQEPKRVVGAFLKLCDMAFVTQESASMLNEALSFQKPVVSLYPKDRKEEDNYKTILNNLSKKEYIYIQDINELMKLKINDIKLKTLTKNSIDEMIEKLKGIV